ncbi:MAG: chorismate mutase [bacterium]|nr:chorismate mutase [bacterium]
MNYTLDDLRKSLDNIDNALIFLLTERFRVTHKVGVFKSKNGLPPVDNTREAAQFERIEKIASDAGLSPEFARKMLRLIIDEVVVNHKVMQQSKE